MCGVYWVYIEDGMGYITHVYLHYISHSITLIYNPCISSLYINLLCCNCNAIQNIQFKTTSKLYNKTLHFHGIFYHQPILTRLKTPSKMPLNKPCFFYPCKYTMLIQTRLKQPINSLRIDV